MSRECTICNHPKRKKIDEMIVHGESIKHISIRFGLSRGAVQRHRQNHVLPPVSPETVAVTVLNPVAETIRTQPVINGFDIENLFHKMEVMVDRSFQLVDKYEMLDPDGKFIGTPADVKAKAAAVNSLRGSLEFISKMFGLISPDGTSPGYLQLLDKYEKQKKFLLEHLCDNCTTELLKYLED